MSRLVEYVDIVGRDSSRSEILQWIVDTAQNWGDVQ